MGTSLSKVTALNGKTIVSATLTNNCTTLTIVLSGGKKVFIKSGMKMIAQIQQPVKVAKIYTQERCE